MNNPSFTLEMGEFKFELSQKITIGDDGRWIYERVIKRTIGENYLTETEMIYFINDQPVPIFDVGGEMPFHVDDKDYDWETNISDSYAFEDFKENWDNSPMVAALANIGLAEISRIKTTLYYMNGQIVFAEDSDD
jgi:hypothetical protein